MFLRFIYRVDARTANTNPVTLLSVHDVRVLSHYGILRQRTLLGIYYTGAIYRLLVLRTLQNILASDREIDILSINTNENELPNVLLIAKLENGWTNLADSFFVVFAICQDKVCMKDKVYKIHGISRNV